MGKFTINGDLTQVMIDILYPSIPSGNMAVRTMVRYEMGDSSRPRPVVLNESLNHQTLLIHIYSDLFIDCRWGDLTFIVS
jgi:hypothetical protein